MLAGRHLVVIPSSRHSPMLHWVPMLRVGSVGILCLEAAHGSHCFAVSLLPVRPPFQLLQLTLSWVLLHHHRSAWWQHVHLTSWVTLLRSLMAHWMATWATAISAVAPWLLCWMARVMWLYVPGNG